MKRKCIIGIIISLNLIILNVCSAFATSPTEVTSAISAVIAALNAAEEGSARQQAVSDWIHKQSGALGFLFDLSSGSLPPSTLKYLLPDPSQYENATDNEIVNACRDLILNHQTVVNNEIVLDTTLNTSIKNFVDNYVSNNPRFDYSFQYERNLTGMNNSTNALNALNSVSSNRILIFNDSCTTYWSLKNDNTVLLLSNNFSQGDGEQISFYRSKNSNGQISVEPYVAENEDELQTVSGYFATKTNQVVPNCLGYVYPVCLIQLPFS